MKIVTEILTTGIAIVIFQMVEISVIITIMVIIMEMDLDENKFLIWMQWLFLRLIF